MKKLFCDKCDKEIKIKPFITTCRNFTGLEPEARYNDLCFECAREIFKNDKYTNVLSS